MPKLAEELEEAVPARGGKAKDKAKKGVGTVQDKIDAAPKDLRAVYDELVERLKALGEDVSVHPRKHYIAFKRNRNFASVQIYNQKRVVSVYLNLDPEQFSSDELTMRDVRQIGHFGTGDLEVTIQTKKDIEKAAAFLKESYDAS